MNLSSFGRQIENHQTYCAHALPCISLARDALENATTRKEKKVTVRHLTKKGERAQLRHQKNWIPHGLVLLELWFLLYFISFSFSFLFLFFGSLFTSIFKVIIAETDRESLFKFTLEMNSEMITLPLINSFSPYIHTYIHACTSIVRVSLMCCWARCHHHQ